MATVTITTTAAEDSRLAPAFGAYLSLPGNATAAQVKAALVVFMKQIVHQYEADQLAKTGPADIAPT
jgi:hypothetical protein